MEIVELAIRTENVELMNLSEIVEIVACSHHLYEHETAGKQVLVFCNTVHTVPVLQKQLGFTEGSKM